MRSRLAMLFVCGILGWPAWPQQPRFTSLSLAEGLSQSQVLSIAQDSEGFLWFSTQDGLNRYDGYIFKVFREADSGLTSSRITALLNDSSERLWIGTRGNGLHIYDFATGYIRKVPTEDESLGILQLFKDRQGQVWVGSRRKGLLKVNESGNALTSVSLPFAPELERKNVMALHQDLDGMLWVGFNDGLLRIDPLTLQDTKPEWLTQTDIEMVQSIASASTQAIWIGSERNGLFVINLQAQTVENFRNLPNDERSLSSDLVSSLLLDQQERLWIGTRNHGLNLFHPESRQFTRYQRDIRNASGISSNKIWSLFQDRSGLIWIGTGDNGVTKLLPDSKPFRHVRFFPDQNDYSDDLVITALDASQPDRAWVGTWGQGLYGFDPQTKASVHFSVEQLIGIEGTVLITAVYAASKDAIWLGIWDQGLLHLNPQTGVVTKFPASQLSEDARPNRITGIQAMDDALYLSTYGTGLFRFDLNANEFTAYAHEPDDPNTIAGRSLMKAVPQGDHFLWIPSIDGGLSRFDLNTEQFVRFQHDPQDSTGLANNRVTCALIDSQDQLWVGTDGSGLQRLQEDGTFRRFEPSEPLPNAVINGILEDQQGTLWVSTNRGLVLMDPITAETRVYGPGDGLPLEYNASVAAASPEGIMFFGSQRGFVYFDPSAIQDNTTPPPVVLTDFKVFNQSLPLTQPLQKTDRIELTYKQNFFAFEFAALDFNNPSENRFYYMMEGFDQHWVDAGTRNYASYTNLEGGTYQFKVRAENSDGYASQTDRMIEVVVIPPFWRTTWFRILLFMIAMTGAGGLVFWFSLKKMRRLDAARKHESDLNQQLNQSREAERLRLAQELHDGPLQDLHAIQLRMAMPGENKRLEISSYIKQVIQNLRYLCGELRPPALGHFGLEVAIRSHTELLKEKHPDLQIKLKLTHDQHHLPADMRLALFRIFQESVNNAIQHAGCGEIQVTFQWDAESITLEVSDDGRGFAYQDFMAYSKKGHYGLMGISERVRAINGTLKILTKPNSGTSVRVQIPAPV